MASEKSLRAKTIQMDDLLLADSERKATVDDKTILNTPIPISASTFRQPLQENSLNLSDNSSLKVSQLASSTLSNWSADRSLPLRNFVTDENQPQEISAREMHGSIGSMSTSRTSWGLVPEECMAELSNDELLPSMSSRMASFAASQGDMRTVDLAESRGLSITSSPRLSSVSETVHKNQTARVESSTVSTSNAWPQSHQSGCSVGPAGAIQSSKSPSFSVKGGVMAVLSAMLGNGRAGQGDSEFEDSVHEVVLNESDIRQFDDEFSDLETTADFEEEELRCEGDLEFSSSRWNFQEETFPQPTDCRLEPINEEPYGSEVFDYDSSEIAEYERQDRLASLYFCPTSSLVNAEGDDSLTEDCRRTSSTALAFQPNGSPDSFQLFLEDKKHFEAEEIETARQDTLLSETMGDGDAGSQDYQSLFQIVQQHITRNSLGQSSDILQPSDTSESSLIDMTLLRSSDGNGDACDVTMKDVSSECPWNGMDTRDENDENRELFKIRFSEVLDLAGGDGFLTLGKFSDTRKEQRKSGQEEASPVSINKQTSNDDNSPVYVNEDGEWVTNLAYSHPLGNPFEDSHVEFGEVANLESFSNHEGIIPAEVFGNEDEFKSGGSCLDMLDMAEKKFEEENVFIQDAVVVPSNTASDTRDSWSFQSHLSHLLYDTSDQADEMEPYMRISIGAFMGLRTEALGSLDGSTDNRPTFGAKFTTPPSNRKPVALLDGTVNGSEVAQEEVEEEAMKSVVTDMFGAATVCSDVDDTLTASALVGLGESGSMKSISRGSSNGNQTPADDRSSSMSQSMSLSELSSTTSAGENHWQFSEIDHSDVSTDPSSVKTNSRSSGLTKSLITQSETSLSEGSYGAPLSKSVNRSKPDVTSSSALTNSQLLVTSKLPTLLAPADTKRSSITKTQAGVNGTKPCLSILSKTAVSNILTDLEFSINHGEASTSRASNLDTISNSETMKPTTSKTLPTSDFDRKVGSLESLKTGSAKCSLPTESTKSLALLSSCKPDNASHNKQELILGSSVCSTKTGLGVGSLKTASSSSSNKKSIPVSASRTKKLQDSKPNSSETSLKKTKPSLSSETRQSSAILDQFPKTDGESKGPAYSNISQSLPMPRAKMPVVNAMENSSVENLTVTSGNEVNFNSNCGSVPVNIYSSSNDLLETTLLNDSSHITDSNLSCSTSEMVSKSKFPSDTVVETPLTSSSNKVPSASDHLKSGTTLTEIEVQNAGSNPLYPVVKLGGYIGDKREVATEGRSSVDSRQKSLEGSWNSSDEISQSGSLEQTTVLNITDIARKISMSSESENPEDLAKLIAVISNSKWNGKNLPEHGARNEVSSDLSKSKKLEVTKAALASNFVDNSKSNCRENIALCESSAARMAKNKTDAVNAVGISSNRIGPNSCSIISEPPSSKENTFKLPEVPLVQKQKPRVIQEKVKEPRTEENFNFRSPRPSSCFSRSKRQELEQSVLVNSYRATEVSFCNHPSMVNETNQPTECYINTAGNVLSAPIDSWSSVDISADLGQTVKLGPSIIKSVVATVDADDAKRNSMSKVARSFSFQQAVAAGDAYNKGNNRTELHVTSSGATAKPGNRAVTADGSEQRKDKNKSAVDKSFSSALPSQSSQPQNSGVLVPQFEAFMSTKTSISNAAGAKSARLSTGLMGDSIFDASRMLPIPEEENTSQLSQYPATKPGLRYAANVSLMTSAMSVSGIDNSLAIDPFSQSTPMVKTSSQPSMYEPTYNIPGYQGGMKSQMMTNQRTDPVHLGLPSELSFQEVCSVGLAVHDTLRVTNPTPYWVHTHFCLVSLSVDGQRLDPFSVVPFVVKQRLMLQPFGSEDVKISFAPRHPGSYVAQLTLLVDQPQHASNIPLTITLRAVAEKPCIQIITPVAELLLDFGALPWGSHKVMPLTLVNKGRAMVPIRLFISSPKSSSCCFSFAYYDGDLTNANMNVSAQCNCILRGIDASAKEFPVTLMVVFRAPNQQSARGLIPVQEALGYIALEIDLPSVIIPLGSVRLKGLSGTARLHAPEKMDVLVLKAEVGTGPQMQMVPLRNAGNIPLDVSLEMAHWTDLFSVTPMQVMIEPGGQSDVCVRFEPTTAAVKGVKFDSLLFMVIEPDGPAYEIPVMGEILSKVSSRELSKLLSNRSFVSWGGMPVGKTGNQMVTLKNNSNKLLKLLLEIQGSPEFKFVMNYGWKEKMTSSWEIVIKSSEEFPINLAFTPTGVQGSSAKLHIRHAGTSIKYSILLSGYGGQSQVVLDKIPLRPEGYYLSTADYNGNREAVVMVTLRNTGTRAAFINGQSFQDLTCSVAQTPGKVIMEPNEFCLPVNEKQDVAIIIRLSDKDLSCWEKSPTSFVTVLSFYYGDEISRQLYQKSLNRGNQPSRDFILASNNPLRNIRFDVHYRNEDLVNEGQDISETADDISLFYKNMTKVTLAVGLSSHGQSAGSLRPLIPDTASGFTVSTGAMQRQMTSPTQALQLSAGERPLPRSDSPPVRDPSHSIGPAISKRSITSEERSDVTEPPAKRGLESLISDSPWRIEPEELCIACAAGDQRPEGKLLYIVNNKDSPIKFDVSWPAHCLCITPEHGTVSPKSSLQLCVYTSDRLKDRGIVLPWNGMLHITCEGQVKVVRVQVLEVIAKCNTTSGVKAVQAHAALAAESLRPGDQPVVVVTVTYPSVWEGESGRAQMVKHSLHFPTTPVGQAQDLPLNIMNASIHRVSWVVSGFTPPYLKPVAHAERTDEDQFRILYTVYSMHQSMGTLEPGQKTRIGVRFRPRQSGSYSQYYDVKFERLDVHEELYTCKLELYGQSTKNESLGVSNSTLGLQGISAVTVSKVSSLSSNSITSDGSKDSSSGSKSRSSKGWLISRPKAVEFPKSSNLEPCLQKVELKNASSVEHKIDILSPVLPFVVDHSQIVIKSRHFLRLPVEFRPTQPGRYHSVLVLKADTGETFVIQLWAESV